VVGELSVFPSTDELVKSIPWNLLGYTIPGVIVGGQVGPRLQGVVQPKAARQLIGTIFGIVGVCFLLETVMESGQAHIS
jgi:uncharacterized membrane protein YfcA